MTGIRIARVSAVQAETGMVSVIYPDQEDAVTDYLPFLSYGEEYHPPRIDDIVMVASLSDGIHSAVVLGGFWNKENRPQDQKAEWSKTLTDMVHMSVKDGILFIHARDIRITTGEKTVSLMEPGGE